MNPTHLKYMQQAYDLALKARGNTSPNPMVGAVIVKQGRVIAQGWHKYCGADHAEIMALKKAGKKAKGATLYITLEPCCHYGRTPPCVDKIISAGIKEIYVGMIDPNPLMRGKSLAKLRRAGVKIHVGLLQKELQRLNESFIKFMKYKIPFVVTKTAQTLDGKVATATGQSKWITSLKTRRFAKQLRNEFDAILVGITTILKDDPGLNPSHSAKRIKKIILDSRLQISPWARLFKGTPPEDCFLATTAQADSGTVASFQKKGVHVIICPQRHGRLDLQWLFKKLAEREITSILIEGGPTVVGNALKSKVVDKMHIYIAPKIMGDEKALNAIIDAETKDINHMVPLKDIQTKRIGEDIFLEGYVYRHR